MKKVQKVAIIGGGASGLLCSILLKKYNSNLDVTIYEGQNKVGKKILQTGNGKCNLSNINITADNFNKKELNNLIEQFSCNKLIEIFNELGLQVRIDEEGRVYPYSEKATTVLDILLKEIKLLKINIVCDCFITSINKINNNFVLSNGNNEFNSDYLIVCTGGCSSISYKHNGYKLLESFNHTITNINPSLCALKTKENTKSLSGLRVKCDASIIVDGEMKHQTKGEVLFKDQGLSGIAIFILSQYYDKSKNCIVKLDLYNSKTSEQLDKELNNNIEEKLIGYFPKMINQDLLKRCEKISIGKVIKNYDFEIIDTYGFNNSQVTKGGIKLEEINLNNFESKKCDNLYIAGEVLDVDGTCGGYNLYFAFASAYKIALDISNK